MIGATRLAVMWSRWLRVEAASAHAEGQRFDIDNWRWSGVPFYLRSGKALPKRLTEIVIQFREVPHKLFHKTAVPRMASFRKAPC